MDYFYDVFTKTMKKLIKKELSSSRNSFESLCVRGLKLLFHYEQKLVLLLMFRFIQGIQGIIIIISSRRRRRRIKYKTFQQQFKNKCMYSLLLEIN